MATIYGPCLNTEHLNTYICLAIHPTSLEDYNPMYKWVFTLLTLSTKKHISIPIQLIVFVDHFIKLIICFLWWLSSKQTMGHHKITSPQQAGDCHHPWSGSPVLTQPIFHGMTIMTFWVRTWLSTFFVRQFVIFPHQSESNPIKSHSDLVKSC
jgi:hypothetical protein